MLYAADTGGGGGGRGGAHACAYFEPILSHETHMRQAGRHMQLYTWRVPASGPLQVEAHLARTHSSPHESRMPAQDRDSVRIETKSP